MWGIAAIAVALYALSYALADALGVLTAKECIGSGFSKACDDVPSPMRDFLLHVFLNLLLGAFANEIWAKDLERRGYESVGYRYAKSLDHLLGILAKENIPTDDVSVTPTDNGNLMMQNRPPLSDRFNTAFMYLMAVRNAEIAQRTAGVSRKEIFDHINLTFSGHGKLHPKEVSQFNQGWDALISHSLLAEENGKLYWTSFSKIIVAYQTIYTSSDNNEEYKDHRLLEDLLEKIEGDARFNAPDESRNQIESKKEDSQNQLQHDDNRSSGNAITLNATNKPKPSSSAGSPLKWGLITLIILFTIIYLSR